MKNRKSKPNVRLIHDFAVRIDDEMTWARANGRTSELNRILRYGTPEQIIKDRLVIASILSGYNDLVWSTKKNRDKIVAALRYAESLAADAEPLAVESAQAPPVAPESKR